MELFHSEGGKLRKKDKIAYYKNDNGDLIAVPTMTSTKEEAFFFLEHSHSSVGLWGLLG